jgi:hypothetical protein
MTKNEEAIKKFLNHMNGLVRYWDNTDNNSTNKLNGLLFSFLVMLDGGDIEFLNGFKLIDKSNNQDVSIGYLHEIRNKYEKLRGGDISEILKKVEGGRYTEEKLNKILSDAFDTEIKVSKYEKEECVKKEIPELDEILVFSGGGYDVDLFYLIDNGGKFYITEFCFTKI